MTSSQPSHQSRPTQRPPSPFSFCQSSGNNSGYSENDEADPQEQQNTIADTEGKQQESQPQCTELANTEENMTQGCYSEEMSCSALLFTEEEDDSMLSPLFPQSQPMPWGRLIPCRLQQQQHRDLDGPSAAVTSGWGGVGGIDLYPRTNLDCGPASVGADEALRSSFIRPPESEYIMTPFPNPIRCRGSNGEGGDESFDTRGNGNFSRRRKAECFMGMSLSKGDVFNEYTLGRSVKSDVCVSPWQDGGNVLCDRIMRHQKRPRERLIGKKNQQQPMHQKLQDGGDPDEEKKEESLSEDEQCRLKGEINEMSSRVHAMISNRHCRIYCLLLDSPSSSSLSSPSPTGNGCRMEVYVEDTSGNGTIVNSTVRLRRGDRRILHTGDEICLLNPVVLSRAAGEGGGAGNDGGEYRLTSRRGVQRLLMSHYSYVFVNLFQQQLRLHGNGISTAKLGQCPTSVNPSLSPACVKNGCLATTMLNDSPNRKRRRVSSGGISTGKGLVDVRTTRNHSVTRKSTPPFSLKKGGRKLASIDDELNIQANERKGAQGIHGSGIGGKNLTQNSCLATGGQHLSVSDSNCIGTTSSKAKKNHVCPPPCLPRQRRFEQFYDLREVIGKGTCGEVRRAIHRYTGKEVAVKIISPPKKKLPIAQAEITPVFAVSTSDNAWGSLTAQQIRAEAEILRSLNHPYIVKLQDVFISSCVGGSKSNVGCVGGAVYLIMELLIGGDLLDRILLKTRYEEIESRRVMRRLLSALHYLHGQNVIHRDLKPENVLCVHRNSDVDVKLTDFGLAKRCTDSFGCKTFCGTPQYFAPEVLRRRDTIQGNGRYGKEADCWSLGVVLYVMLSGTPPFDVRDEMDAEAVSAASEAMVHISFTGVVWEGVSAGAKDLVSKLLKPNPTERMTVEQACDHEWILMEDGDTHRHPLDDPRVLANFPVKISSEIQSICDVTSGVCSGRTPPKVCAEEKMNGKSLQHDDAAAIFNDPVEKSQRELQGKLEDDPSQNRSHKGGGFENDGVGMSISSSVGKDTVAKGQADSECIADHFCSSIQQTGGTTVDTPLRHALVTPSPRALPPKAASVERKKVPHEKTDSPDIAKSCTSDAIQLPGDVTNAAPLTSTNESRRRMNSSQHRKAMTSRPEEGCLGRQHGEAKQRRQIKRYTALSCNKNASLAYEVPRLVEKPRGGSKVALTLGSKSANGCCLSASASAEDILALKKIDEVSRFRRKRKSTTTECCDDEETHERFNSSRQTTIASFFKKK